MKNNRIDVCLIYLPKPYLKQPLAQAPAGLLYIAASLEHKGRSVIVENYASFSDEAAIFQLPPATLYGITATSLEILQANRFSKLIKQKYADAKIIIGGPGAYSEEFVDFSIIDSVFFGDGEITIHEVLQDAEKGVLKQRYYGQAVTELDTLPFPARHLLKDHQGGDIFAHGKHYAEGDSTVIISSRGCPMKCAFCSAPILTCNNKLRFRSPKNVAYEMQHVKDTYGIKQFRFSDDFFTASLKRVFDLCKVIGKLDLHWRISCRVNPLNRDMIKAMKDAGLKEMSFGIESFDDNVLRGLNKKSTAKENVRALELSAKEGINSRALMMIHTPFQTKKTIELNKKYLSNTPISILALTSFIPIPGCDIYYNPDKYDIELLNINLDDFNFYFFGPDGRLPIKPIFKQKNRSVEEFIQESESFRDWVENDYENVNKG